MTHIIENDERMCNVVRYISECDVKPVSEPLPYTEAVKRLAEHLDNTPHDDVDFDLVDVTTGRFVSWVLGTESGITGAM